jgi:hypothetical protein
MLDIFKIKDYNFSQENLSKIKKHCSIIKHKYSNNEDICNLYIKAQKIIECIYELIDNHIISLDDLTQIHYYTDKIKQVESFEKYDKKTIIKDRLHINSIENIENVQSNIDKNEKNKLVGADLNDPNYNVLIHPNPSLNNKNNTNLVFDSFPNAAAPGKLNSLKRITLSQNLNLNSCFRNNYYTNSSTDFQYLLPCEIKNVISIRLASIEIPNAWYLFSHKQKNNVFKIIVCQDNITTNHTIVIPDGNYDNESLADFLNTTYFFESNLETPLKHIRFSIGSVNFKTRFEIVNTETINSFCFTLVFFEDINENLMNTAGWILGFRLPKYLNIYENIQSEGLFDGSGDKYVYFSLNDYQYNTNSTNIVGFDKSIMEEYILAKIPMINGKLSLIIDDNNNPLAKIRRYNGPVTLKKLYIKIFDRFGNIIDLNNMDFSFTVEMELLYESFNFKDVTY